MKAALVPVERIEHQAKQFACLKCHFGISSEWAQNGAMPLVPRNSILDDIVTVLWLLRRCDVRNEEQNQWRR